MNKHRPLTLLRSRIPVLLGVLGVVVALAVGTVKLGSLPAAWDKIDAFPAMSPTFADTRTVTHSIDCVIQGRDPFTGQCDPWHRGYNYPPIWLGLRYLGVTSRSTTLVAVLMVCMTTLALLMLFRAKTFISGVIIFLSVISRSVLYLVERGNIDQVVFFLLVVGLFLIGRQRKEFRTFAVGLLIVVLTVLKVYPIAVVAVLARNRRGIMAALITMVVSVAAVVLTSGRDFIRVIANTPQYIWGSFGAYPLFFLVTSHTLPSLATAISKHHAIASAGSCLLAGITVLVANMYRDKVHQWVPPLNFDRARGCIAISCLAIFCFVFLCGAAFNYRLVFLIGPVAYLVDDLNEQKSLRSLPMAILLLVELWKPASTSLVRELVDGAVFVATTAWLSTSVIARLRNSNEEISPDAYLESSPAQVEAGSNAIG